MQIHHKDFETGLFVGQATHSAADIPARGLIDRGMFSRIFALAFLGLSLSSRALGNIGETPEECAKSYGEPTNKGNGTDGRVGYKKDGLLILVIYSEGKAASILFHHSQTDESQVSKPLSDTEIQALLDANKGNATWVKGEKDGSGRDMWKLSDSSAWAGYGGPKNSLFITTAALLKKRIEERAAAEKKSSETSEK